MKKLNDDEFILESGRTIYVNCSILGIAETRDGLCAFEGYDAHLGSPDEFTLEERKEIANYAIGLWEKFKEDAGKAGKA